jgi:hypothetical protein
MVSGTPALPPQWLRLPFVPAAAAAAAAVAGLRGKGGAAPAAASGGSAASGLRYEAVVHDEILPKKTHEMKPHLEPKWSLALLPALQGPCFPGSPHLT